MKPEVWDKWIEYKLLEREYLWENNKDDTSIKSEIQKKTRIEKSWIKEMFSSQKKKRKRKNR